MKMNPSEYLSPDILGRNFVWCFMPVHFAQWVMGCSRVDVRAKFVTPPTWIQKLYSLVIATAVGGACLNLLSGYHENYYSINRAVYTATAAAINMNYWMYVCKLFHARFVGLNQSVRLYVLMQKTDRILNLTHNKSVYRQQLYLNLTIVVVSLMHIPGATFHLYLDKNKNYMIYLCVLIQVVSYLETLFIGILLHFVTVRLKFLNKAIKDLASDKEAKLALVNCWVEKDRCNTSFPSAKFALTLKLILATFKVINKIYSFEILMLTTCTVLWPLLIVEGLVIGLGSQIFSSLATIAIVMWVVIFYLQIVFLSMACDRFQKEIQQTKRLCIEVMFECYEGPLMESVKKMLTIIEWEAPKFSVYGIFRLERQLPLHLLSLITNYVIILVQFTLL